MNRLITSPRNRQRYILPYLIEGKTLIVAPKIVIPLLKDRLEVPYLDLSNAKVKDIKHRLLLSTEQVLLVNQEKLYPALQDLLHWSPDTVALFYGESITSRHTKVYQALEALVSIPALKKKQEVNFRAGMGILPDADRLFCLSVLLGHKTKYDSRKFRTRYGVGSMVGNREVFFYPKDAAQLYWEQELKESEAFEFVDLRGQEDE